MTYEEFLELPVGTVIEVADDYERTIGRARFTKVAIDRWRCGKDEFNNPAFGSCFVELVDPLVLLAELKK